MIEWGAHSIWIQVGLSMCIYILMNMSRVGLVMGIAKLFWKSLHPGLFTFKGSATREGELVVGSEFAEKKGEGGEEGAAEKGEVVEMGSSKFGRLIKEALDKILPKHRLKGIPMVLMALALNVPWVYALMKIGYNIAYKP